LNFFAFFLFLIFHATGPWGTGVITYDARGNITGQSLGNFNTGLSYNATTGQLAAAYIAQNGIAFNALDQLTCAACNTPAASTQYAYDGLGTRIWSQKGTAPKTYEFHSRDNKLLMEWQGRAAGFTKEHIYAGQRRVAEVHIPTGQAAKVTHSHPDPSGSPAMLSDASGLVSAREHYRPYGDKLISPNTNESAGFANKAFDASTNLSYMSARYYNPTLGRFISPDPVHFVEGNIHSFNRYAYANNNPMRYIDPTGMFTEETAKEADKMGVQGGPKPAEVQGPVQQLTTGLAIATVAAPLAVAAGPTLAGLISAGWNAAKGLLGFGSKASPQAAPTTNLEIHFGRNQNQINHATRHVEAKGLNADAVKDAVRTDLSKPGANLSPGLNKSSVTVDGVKVDYAAFKGADGAINVGRMTPSKP
jgi:RHS repeat-associated protein